MTLSAVILLGQFVPTRYIWHCLEILSVTSGNDVASSGYRPGMLLNILLYMQEIIITPRISAIPSIKSWSGAHLVPLPRHYYSKNSA